MSSSDLTRAEPIGIARKTATTLADFARRIAKLERLQLSNGRLPGELIAYGGSAAPTGWLLCDGSAVSRTDYATLFSIIGTTFGAGNGSTTFNLPDLRGRTPYGVGTHADVDTVGKNDGEGVASRSPKHVLTIAEMPSHQHAMNLTQGLNVAGGGGGVSGYLWHNSGPVVTGLQGSSAAHQHGYAVANWIVKT